MANDAKIFEDIVAKCPEKKIQSCAKKMIKKPAITGQATASVLCDLAYWLYIYGYEKEALAVCEYAHLPFPQPGKVLYTIWDFVLFIWGLEAYIYQKQGDFAKSQARVEAMLQVWRTPSDLNSTEEQTEKLRAKIASRLTYAQAIDEDRIRQKLDDSVKTAQESIKIALLTMIGYGATGLYPDLVAHQEELEAKIQEYVALARSV